MGSEKDLLSVHRHGGHFWDGRMRINNVIMYLHNHYTAYFKRLEQTLLIRPLLRYQPGYTPPMPRPQSKSPFIKDCVMFVDAKEAAPRPPVRDC